MKKRVKLTIEIFDIPHLPGEQESLKGNVQKIVTFDTQSGKITTEGDLYPSEHRMCSALTDPVKFFVREQERYSNLALRKGNASE